MLLSLSMATGLYLALTLPRTYIAEAVVLIPSENLPDPLVETNPIILSHQIKRHGAIRKAIKETGIFSESGYELVTEEEKLVLMQRNMSVRVKNDDETIAIAISLKGDHPEKTAAAVNSIAADFVDRKIRLTTEFLADVRDFVEAKLRVRKKERRLVEGSLKAYHADHTGRLPKDLNTNMHALSKLRGELTEDQERLSDKQIRLAQQEAQAEAIRREMEAHAPPKTPESTVWMTSEDALELERLKAEYVRLVARYTHHHPDVISAKEKIAELEPEVERQAQERGLQIERRKREAEQAGETHRAATLGELREVDARGDALRREIKKDQKNLSRLRRQIRICEKRIEDTPKREQEMAALQRAYETIQEACQPLLKKRMEADMLLAEWRKTGPQHLHIQHPAQPPDTPVGPDIRKLFLFSLGAGIGAGLMLAILLELFRDASPISVRRRIGQVLNICLVLVTLSLFAGFACLASKGPVWDL